MTVYFIGAGPGAADLITLRAANILSKVRVCLYAGSLIPLETVKQWVSADCKLIDTQHMNLEAIIDAISAATDTRHHCKKQSSNTGGDNITNTNFDIARLHSGDLSFFSAVAEQKEALENLGISVEYIPGISAYSACCAAAKITLTKPSISQAVVLARPGYVGSKVPPKQKLSNLAQNGATLVIHLTRGRINEVISELRTQLDTSVPCIVVRKASRSDELVIKSNLGRIEEQTKGLDLSTSTMIIGQAIASDDRELLSYDHHNNIQTNSYLYSKDRIRGNKTTS